MTNIRGYLQCSGHAGKCLRELAFLVVLVGCGLNYGRNVDTRMDVSALIVSYLDRVLVVAYK
jgi:hypothetical protein